MKKEDLTKDEACSGNSSISSQNKFKVKTNQTQEDTQKHFKKPIKSRDIISQMDDHAVHYQNKPFRSSRINRIRIRTKMGYDITLNEDQIDWIAITYK